MTMYLNYKNSNAYLVFYQVIEYLSVRWIIDGFNFIYKKLFKWVMFFILLRSKKENFNNKFFLWKTEII